MTHILTFWSLIRFEFANIIDGLKTEFLGKLHYYGGVTKVSILFYTKMI